MSAPTFRDLHAGPDLLLLANAWDAASARLIESLGARAIATTSAGFAWACGYADGNTLPRAELLAAVERIARVVRVPLSIDIEAGYSDEPQPVAELAAALIDRGVAGINLEDSAGPPARLAAKIESVKARAAQAGADLFVNARTDVYLRGLAQGEAAVTETVRRARAYLDAGCDGLFVPGLADMASAKAIADAIAPAPLNLMLVPGLPDAATLQRAGVRRLSAGAEIAQIVLATTATLAGRFLGGDWAGMRGAPIDYMTMNGLLAERSAQ